MVGKQRNNAVLRYGNNKLNKRPVYQHDGRATKPKSVQDQEHHDRILTMLNAAMVVLHEHGYRWDAVSEVWVRR